VADKRDAIIEGITGTSGAPGPCKQPRQRCYKDDSFMADPFAKSSLPLTGSSDAGEPMAYRAQRLVEDIQNQICQAVEAVDGKARFREDRWQREEGGGGITRAIEEGSVFEKGGVNTSAVHGPLPDRMAKMLQVESTQFFATGISLVLHPESPFVPTVHANFRYFALGENLAEPVDEWFGGGADLSPYYPFLQDTHTFHAVWKEVCDRHEVAEYRAFKEHCDSYFFLPNRGEARGVGGIFYDYLRGDREAHFAFMEDAAGSFLRSYLPIVERRRAIPFGEQEKRYQRLRRGRYVEFNLLYDRGTRFGIETGGRTESILMSLPPEVSWQYDWRPEPGSAEERARAFYQAHDWLGLDGPSVTLPDALPR
jgi:coproporphyrinogen III oxidase